MIGTTVKLSFDGSAVAKGFATVGAGFKALGAKMATVGRAMLAPFAKLMALLAPILTVGAFSKGLKDALDFGGAISDLSARTGIAAGEIVVLQEALRRAGMESSDVATTLQRMGRNVIDGLAGSSRQAAEALEMLGLDAFDLDGKNLAETFEIIGSRVAGLDSEFARASATAAIFGREGFKLVNLFKTSDFLNVARQSVGGLADTMNRSANAFDHVSDALGALGTKWRQFFSAVAETAIGPLTEVADKINSLDLTEAGQKVGEFAKTVRDMFSAGTLGSAIWESLKFAGARLIELLTAGMKYAAEVLNEAVSKTDLGKKLGVKSVTESTRTYSGEGQITRGGPMGIQFSPKYTEGPGREVKAFSDFYSEIKGTLGSQDAADKISAMRERAEMQRRIEWLQKSSVNDNAIKDLLRSIDRRLAGNNQTVFE